MWFTAGSDVALTIDYKVDGQFVTPDSVVYQVRDQLGAIVLSNTLPAALNSEILNVPAAFNLLAASSTFENRFVLVQFLYQGATHQVSISYRIMDFVPMTATTDQVRAELGLDYSELPDADIDIHRAYFNLINTYGPVMVAAFFEASVKSLAANQAVVLQAAVEIIDSLELRAAVTMRSEDHLISRKTNLDFQALGLRLRQKLTRLLLEAQGITDTNSVVAFRLSNPTDAVTGA